MIFHDILHREVHLAGEVAGPVLKDLLRCPELLRLRHMRLVNFDVPLIQDLATARRYAHAIGTCHVALRLAYRSGLGPDETRHLAAAALLHDVGILPYGHLVERHLHISHEALVRAIVSGTYHPTNVYHQILPGRSLRLFSVLARHDLDAARLLTLVNPTPGASTPICGALDVDNLDNVHRMAALMGFADASSNVETILRHAFLTPGGLTVAAAAIPAIEMWLSLRSNIYSIMIAHPECVAYNAFLQDLVAAAVQLGLVSDAEWFLSDAELEKRLIHSPSSASLAAQLLTGTTYDLLDYAWLRTSPPTAPSLALISANALGDVPVPGSQHFVWFDRDKTSRRVHITLVDGTDLVLGHDSESLLIALIDPGNVSNKHRRKYHNALAKSWRRQVVDAVERHCGPLTQAPVFPEEFRIGQPKPKSVQLEF